MIYTEATKKALLLAFEAHNGQLDKAGLPYICHPLHVAEQMTDEDSAVTALLHDVAEDTDVSLADIAAAGFKPEALQALADSIAVGVPRNPDKAINAIRESQGLPVEVTDAEIMAAQKLLGTTCGVFGEPAGVTGAAGLKKLCEQGKLSPDATVVSVVTGNGLKDVANAIQACGEPISVPSDMEKLLSAFAEREIPLR